MKTVIAAIIVSVIVSSTATAGVTTLITSKDIKNGTIRPVDLSAAAKRAMRGPQGLQGQPGPSGPQGPQGPAGFNSVVTASSSSVVAPNNTGTTAAYCPSGTKAVGGGYRSSDPNMWAYSSVPADDGDGWRVYVSNAASGTRSYTAYVLCAG